MDELESVLDALAADDLGGLVASQVLAGTTLRVKARSRIDAELARTVRKGGEHPGPGARRAEADAVVAARPCPAVGA
jgi:ribosomal protein L19E